MTLSVHQSRFGSVFEALKPCPRYILPGMFPVMGNIGVSGMEKAEKDLRLFEHVFRQVSVT